MNWGMWIGLGWTIFVAAITIAIQYGVNKNRFESIFKKLDEKQDKDDAQDAAISKVREDTDNKIEKLKLQNENDLAKLQDEMTRHAGDMDKHWTSRERDAHTKQLYRIEELLNESLTDRANIGKDIAVLKDYIMNLNHNRKEDKQ